MTGTSEERMMCLVCGRVLDYWEHADGTGGWGHSLMDARVDHPAVPVPAGEAPQQLRSPRCDFCETDEPRWELPVAPFAYRMLVPGRPLHGSVDNWAACDGCARLIKEEKWLALAHRVQEVKHLPGSRWTRVLRQMFEVVRRNATGPLHRMEGHND